MRRSRLVRLLLAMLPLVLVAMELYARTGGGGSYSGGGSSSGGGSGSGGGGGELVGELIYLILRFLFWLTIHHPAIGIPTDCVVAYLVFLWLRKNRDDVARQEKSVQFSRVVRPKAGTPLDALRRFDPNFSEVTFADFCYSLYARAHQSRATGDLGRYAPYLSTAARNSLRSLNPAGLTDVKGIIIGSMQVGGLTGIDTQTVKVDVTFESNVTEVAGGREESFYLREEWHLERARDILSPPPEKAKADHCPRCGAALDTRTDGACAYCGATITDGKFQWYVRSTTLLGRESRGPLLTSDVPEQGTDRASVMQRGFAAKRSEFSKANPDFKWDEFDQHVTRVAFKLQDAWTARDWEPVRAMETEGLFQQHRYWIDAYRKQGLRNVVDDFQVTNVSPVKIVSDAFYDAITVRIWANGRDYTVDESGKVVAGSKTNVRKWTEYWTFIRSRSGAAASGSTVTCPNCGASVVAGPSGKCDFCGGVLQTGQFGWVLSRIEQDDSYSAS